MWSRKCLLVVLVTPLVVATHVQACRQDYTSSLTPDQEIASLLAQIEGLERRFTSLEAKLNVTSQGKQAQRGPRIGQIIIVGNERTPMSFILKRIGLFPGQVLDRQTLRKAEQNLPGLRPSIVVLDPDRESQFRDVMVTVHEN
jgi:hypothetical protein